MVWREFAASRLSSITQVDGKVNAQGYLDVLEQHVKPLNPTANGVTYQQDNAPIHKSRRVTQ